MKRLVAIAVAVALLALGIVLARAIMTSSGARAFPSEVASGARPLAPDFTLRTLDGTGTVSLADLRGQIVVINFWASWCDPCKEEAPVLEDFWQTEAEPNGVAFVGIDTQDLSDDARAFAKTYALTYPLVHDAGGEVGRDYGVGAFPETFVVDAQGRAVPEGHRGHRHRKHHRGGGAPHGGRLPRRRGQYAAPMTGGVEAVHDSAATATRQLHPITASVLQVERVGTARTLRRSDQRFRTTCGAAEKCHVIERPRKRTREERATMTADLWSRAITTWRPSNRRWAYLTAADCEEFNTMPIPAT